MGLDPLTCSKDLQRAKFRKSITGHNFWLEWPTDLISTPLSYIFNTLFRDTPLAYLTWHLTRDLRDVCDTCDMTYVTRVTWQKVGKWGIPEKSSKNAAQRRWPQVRRTLKSKVMAGYWFLEINPLYFALWMRGGPELREGATFEQNIFSNIDSA